MVKKVVSRELSPYRSILLLTLECGHVEAVTACPGARDTDTCFCHQCAQKDAVR